MKITFSSKVYNQLSLESRLDLQPVRCDCNLNPDCEMCAGGGIVYTKALSPEDSTAIENNLRSQGVPLGKANTN